MNKRFLMMLLVVILAGALVLVVVRNYVSAPAPIAAVEILEIDKPEQNQNLGELIVQSEKPVVVDFNASWCGPCKMMKPIFKELEEELRDDYLFVDADVDEYTELALQYQITAYPTLVFVKDGVEVHRAVGGKTKEELKEIIEQVF